MIYTKCVYSDDLEFEWDENKNLANIEKHGIDFNDARIVFFEWCVLGLSKKYLFEERWICYGNFKGRIITIVFTKRNDRIRLISARRSHEKEREIFHENIKK